MIFAELLAFIALLSGIGVSGSLVWAWIRSSNEKVQAEHLRDIEMQSDLRTALLSRDHRRLDDFLVMWADRVPKEIKKHVEQRRDELYIDADNRK